jgi:hypothetical protein
VVSWSPAWRSTASTSAAPSSSLRQSRRAASLSERVMAASIASQSARPAAIAATITGTFIVDHARLSRSSPRVSI